MCETGMGRGQLVFVLAPPEAVIGLQVSPIELVVRPLLFRVFVSFPFFRALALALAYLDWEDDPQSACIDLESTLELCCLLCCVALWADRDTSTTGYLSLDCLTPGT